MSYLFDPGASRALPWSADDEWLQCVQVRDETHDVRTFVLRSQQPRLFRFRPGQFMTYSLPIDGEIVQRCYTISSAPTRPDTLSLTVKRVAGGIASNWLHDYFKPGMTLSALGPAGEFSCFLRGSRASDAPAPMMFISGGSGVTPLMAMARCLHDIGNPVDLVFLHAARTPADIIFADEVGLIARQLPGFQPSFVCDRRGSMAGWSGMLGRVNLTMLQSLAPDFAQREIYCCGPAPFMAAVRELLIATGYDMSRYYDESFDFGALASESAALVAADQSLRAGTAGPGSEAMSHPTKTEAVEHDPAGLVSTALDGVGTRPVEPAAAISGSGTDVLAFAAVALAGTDSPAEVATESETTLYPDDPLVTNPVVTHTVTFSRRGESFPCTNHQTVLAAAIAAGLRMPFSCAQGICGTCRTVRLTGEVDMNAKGGIRPREIREGWFLPCCSTPKSDLVVDR